MKKHPCDDDEHQPDFDFPRQSCPQPTSYGGADFNNHTGYNIQGYNNLNETTHRFPTFLGYNNYNETTRRFPTVQLNNHLSNFNSNTPLFDVYNNVVPFQYHHRNLDPCLNRPLFPSLPSLPPPPTHNIDRNRTVCLAPTSGTVILNGRDETAAVEEEEEEVPDIPDTCFNYITELLRDDYPDDQPLGTLQDYMAYQTLYDTFNDTLSSGNNNPAPTSCRHSSSQPVSSSLDNQGNNYRYDIGEGCRQQQQHHAQQQQQKATDGGGNNFTVSSSAGSSHGSNSFKIGVDDSYLENQTSISDLSRLQSSLFHFPLLQQALLPPTSSSSQLNLLLPPFTSSNQQQINVNVNPNPNPGCFWQSSNENVRLDENKEKVYAGGNDEPSRRGRNQPHQRRNDEEEGEETRRINKQRSTTCPETYPQISEYEEDLFCPEDKKDNNNNNTKQSSQPCVNQKNPEPTTTTTTTNKSEKKKGSSRTSRGAKNKKQSQTQLAKKKPEVVDLIGLLTLCSESVARTDIKGAQEQLRQIRNHSSPYGDCIQRLSHYFANALERRLFGGNNNNRASSSSSSTTEFLKANRIYVAAVPFQIMSYYVANKTIAGLTMSSSRIHIIDFGISYGLQWPCIINNLSRKGPCPPRIKITGIDFPESGFRPGESLKETGRCLQRYSERFGVPFEYRSIVAGSWEDVKLDDLELDKGDEEEMVVVNCLYRSHHVFDESVDLESSPREGFLGLVRRINPSYFVISVVNGSFSAPYFAMRFKEALSYYGALYDLVEVTMPREDRERMLLEELVFGDQVMNVIACEGKERIERPESYRRWVVRLKRAGFKQEELDTELVRRARAMVGKSFRKEFLFDEEGQWAVQGWKGKILYAVSCWRPN